MAIALSYAARSNVGLGPKSRNEDSGYAGPHLLVLADGMGGHSAGDVASSMIVGTLVPLDGEDVTPERAVPALETALREANRRMTAAMDEDDELAGMGSTTIALLRTGNKIAMAHIGDSRAFLLRGGTFSQITHDHSFVQQLVDEGRITPEQAHTHPQRSVVTRVMTGSPEDVPDTSLREAKVGDRFLLCSDGLSDFVSTEVIEEVLAAASGPSAAAERLVEVALRASTRDNVTVVVADVVDADHTLTATEPVVVGAAAKRMPRGPRTRAMPVTPAEKAAALSRAATGRTSSDDDDESDAAELDPTPAGSARGRWVRRGLAAAVVLGLFGGGGYAAYAWSQNQYYVAADGANVAIYQGVSARLGPLSLSQVLERTDIPVADLPADVSGTVDGSLTASDLTDARSTVNRLRLAAQQCRTQRSLGQACGSGSVSAIPTSGATGTPAPATTGIGTPGATDSPVTASSPPITITMPGGSTITFPAAAASAPDTAGSGAGGSATPGTGPGPSGGPLPSITLPTISLPAPTPDIRLTTRVVP